VDRESRQSGSLFPSRKVGSGDPYPLFSPKLRPNQVPVTFQVTTSTIVIHGRAMFNRLRIRFRGLFLSVLLVVVTTPLLAEGRGGGYLFQLLLTAVFLGALNAVSHKKRTLRFGLALALPAVVASWTARFLPGIDALAWVDLVFTTAFLCFTSAHILGYVFRARRVTSEILFGALSVYLLIGVTFALVFTTVEARHPGSLSLPAIEAGQPDPRPFATISYFSFVTMTTLGYGDIGPLTPAARSLVTLEALLGQLFLAVLMARLVALHILHETEAESDPIPDPKRE
jgi:hypothetical protein